MIYVNWIGIMGLYDLGRRVQVRNSLQHLYLLSIMRC